MSGFFKRAQDLVNQLQGPKLQLEGLFSVTQLIFLGRVKRPLQIFLQDPTRERRQEGSRKRRRPSRRLSSKSEKPEGRTEALRAEAHRWHCWHRRKGTVLEMCWSAPSLKAAIGYAGHARDILTSLTSVGLLALALFVVGLTKMLEALFLGEIGSLGRAGVVCLTSSSTLEQSSVGHQSKPSVNRWLASSTFILGLSALKLARLYMFVASQQIGQIG